MVEEVRTLGAFDDLRRYVAETLCRLELLNPHQAYLECRTLYRRGTPCGVQFTLEGPRSLVLSAIWDAQRNELLFYGSSGARVQRTRLASGPPLAAVEAGASSAARGAMPDAA